jgi:hypothetical protein
MKLSLLLLLLTLTVCAGCATRYTVTMTSGRVFTAMGKPRLNKATNHYTFKLNTGEKVEVSRFSIREIAPESMRSEEGQQFKPTPVK